MKTRLVISADEGKILTNGEMYGKSIFLAESANIEDFYEITQEEYNAILEAEHRKALEGLEG